MPTIKKRSSAAKNQPEQEVMTIAHHIAAFLHTYKKYFMTAAIALVAVLALAGGYAIMVSMNEQKAAPLVAAAYENYSPAGGTPADYQKSLTLFRDIQKKYSNTMSGAIAAYYVGNCFANLGRTEDALKEYQQFIQDYSGRKFLLGLVYQRMGYLYVGLDRQADAINAWEKAETINGPGISTVELAKLYEATGNLPEAQKKYKLIINKLGGTTWAMEAMAMMQNATPMPVPNAGKTVE
jgi:tetratricopeptide (TPR) repeat protein